MNKQVPGSSPAPHRCERLAAFTIVETMVAVSVCAVALTAFFMTTSQAVRLARSSRETATASQLLEQRLAAVRVLTPWSNVITLPSVNAVMANASPAAAAFPPVTEAVTVAPWPANSDYFTVTRGPTGSLSTAGASLPNSPTCVQVKVQITWTNTNQQTVTRSATTLLAKGGL